MNLTSFTSDEFWTIRAAVVDGKPFFHGRDVAAALGYSNPLEAIRTHCKGVREILTPSAGGDQLVRFIPESDLYRLIMRSRLPAAERFQDWVVEEVLPAIHKTGSYSAVPQSLPEALRLAADLAEKADALAIEVQTMQPKAEFYDAVTASDDTIQLAVACQVLDLPFGRNTLFQRLRERGVLITGGDRHNLPKQRYVEQGLFTVKESTFLDDHKQPRVGFTPLVTQKGLDWIRKEFGRAAA